MPTLTEIHTSKSGKVSDKWESYLKFYDSVFADLKDKPISMMEIGVQNGGSLESWASYFHNAKLILGVDIDERVLRLKFDSSVVKILVGDICSAATFQDVSNTSTRFDIIIDDGSHRSPDILQAFISYFPLLKDDGLYIIEDTHCVYDSGEIFSESGTYAFFKKCIDLVNYEHWCMNIPLPIFLNTFFNTGKIPGFILEGHIGSIEFRNSLILIRKSSLRGHSKRGDRLITGRVANVQSWGGRFK